MQTKYCMQHVCATYYLIQALGAAPPSVSAGVPFPGGSCPSVVAVPSALYSPTPAFSAHTRRSMAGSRLWVGCGVGGQYAL